jgi:site-specific DNA-methyltransferase (adenine-specific)
LIQPYYNKAGVTIYLADCREVLQQFAVDSFDASVNDPPYGVRVESWDDAVPYDVLSSIRSVTSGPVAWFGAAPTNVMARDLAQFVALGVLPQRTLIWAPKFTLSHTRAHNIYFRWHPIYCWDLPARHCGPQWDILDVATNTGRRWWKHKGTKPVKLMQQLLGLAVVKSGQVARVLDAFAGSGSTLVAAKTLGFQAVGIDCDEESCEIAAKRLDATSSPGKIGWLFE